MAQVIQAKCPHCQNVLRIPAEWVGQPMRCKHCRQVFQARSRVPVAPPAPAEVPPAARPLAPPTVAWPAPPASTFVESNGDPFAFDQDSEPAPSVRRRRRKSGGWWKGLVVGLSCLALAAGITVFAGKQLLGRVRKHNGTSEPQARAAEEPATATEREQPRAEPSHREGTDRETERPAADPPTGREPPPKKSVGKPPPVKEPPVQKQPPPVAKKGPPAGGVLFPRRALAVSVCEYWLANPLAYGRPRANSFPGSSTRAVLNALGNFTMKFPNTQLTELSDQGLDPQTPLKPVIEGTIEDFLKSCRDQDRIVLLFAGHAAEVGKEAYLVPVLGDLKDAKTLIPLKWVYDRLRECKARQKVLILDVCRFDPARGMERPGSEPMGKALDAALQRPPEGVQVWSSCVAKQNAYEFESGSLFLQALSAAMNERLPGFQ
jgi:hypothetical protein